MLSSDQSLMNGNVSITDPETGKKHRTSIRLEKLEWDTMRRICAINKMTIHEFCTYANVHARRKERSRTSRIRCAILAYCLDHGLVFKSPEKVSQQYWKC